jgi:hypothetical protein
MWEQLGIEPTSDPKAVRRAYAQRLHAIDGDLDPGAFKNLRAAYEQALRHCEFASRRQARAAPQPAQQPIAVAPTAPVQRPPEPSGEEIERAKMNRALNAALSGGNMREALDIFERAIIEGTIGLGQRDVFVERIVTAAMADKTLSPQDYTALLRRVGWHEVPKISEYASHTRNRALSRAEAEAWYLRLCETARGRPRLGRDSFLAYLQRRRERRAACAVLDGAWFPRWSAHSFAILKNMLAHAQHYRPQIGFRLNDDHIKDAQAMLRHEAVWRFVCRALFIAFALVLFVSFIGIGIALGGYPLFAFALVSRWVFPELRKRVLQLGF